MRRSGMTSRSKWASFSISQISSSRAGPRGPAVLMLRLSATGAPLASVMRRSMSVISWSIRVGEREAGSLRRPARPLVRFSENPDSGRTSGLGDQMVFHEAPGAGVGEGRGTGVVAIARMPRERMSASGISVDQNGGVRSNGADDQPLRFLRNIFVIAAKMNHQGALDLVCFGEIILG